MLVQVQEVTVPYAKACGTNAVCTAQFTVPSKMEKPVYVYYQLSNFYQNHRRYVQSRSDKQLRGDFGGSDATAGRAGGASGGVSCRARECFRRELRPCGLHPQFVQVLQ